MEVYLTLSSVHKLSQIYLNKISTIRNNNNVLLYCPGTIVCSHYSCGKLTGSLYFKSILVWGRKLHFFIITINNYEEKVEKMKLKCDEYK